MSLLFKLIIFYTGACLASFITVCAWRWPQGASIITPRSHCDHCQAVIAWYDLFPIISYMILHGRCRTCNQPICRQFWRFEWAGGGLAVMISQASWSVATSYLLCILFGLSVTDQLYTAIFPLPMLIAALPLFYLYWPTYHWLAALSIACCLFLFSWGSQAFGCGDVEVLSLLTLWLGLEFTLQSLLLGCFGCLVRFAIKKIQSPHNSLRADRIPFIPYISIGVLVCLIYQNY